MEIQFRTAEQRRIADLLWSCETNKEVDVVLRAFGLEAYVVREMLVAATFDDIVEVDLAQAVLKPYTL
jgi:hypothetical protein